MALQDLVEEVQVLGHDLVEQVKGLIHEGNVRRIIIKDVQGNTFVEIPVTVAAVGLVLAPVLAAVGAISALVAKFTIVVERTEPRSLDSLNTPKT
jgi:hypothetical protein